MMSTEIFTLCCTYIGAENFVSASKYNIFVPFSIAQWNVIHISFSVIAIIMFSVGQVVWISTDHSQSAQSTQLHSSPTLGLQENQNSTNTSLHDHEQSFPSPQHAAHS